MRNLEADILKFLNSGTSMTVWIYVLYQILEALVAFGHGPTDQRVSAESQED
jgi:hypothetical protein